MGMSRFDLRNWGTGGTVEGDERSSRRCVGEGWTRGFDGFNVLIRVKSVSRFFAGGCEVLLLLLLCLRRPCRAEYEFLPLEVIESLLNPIEAGIDVSLDTLPSGATFLVEILVLDELCLLESIDSLLESSNPRLENLSFDFRSRFVRSESTNVESDSRELGPDPHFELTILLAKGVRCSVRASLEFTVDVSPDLFELGHRRAGQGEFFLESCDVGNERIEESLNVRRNSYNRAGPLVSSHIGISAD